MYITFLIGNGFDINLGLKTKYVDLDVIQLVVTISLIIFIHQII